MKSEVFTAVNIKIMDSDMMPCSLVGPWRWRHQVHLKCWFLSVKLHGITPYKTNNIWDFHVYNLRCTCIICIQLHVIRNSTDRHSVLYFISLITFCIDTLYSIYIYIFFFFPPVLHTHENIVICLMKYNNINHSRLYLGVGNVQLMPARVCLSHFCTRICINHHLHLYWRFMMLLQRK